MKKVFIYVGHSNWGKSMALKIITGNNSRQKTVEICGYNVRVRKMSNDDHGQKLLDWVKTFPRQVYDHHIIAFCPKVTPANGNATPAQLIAADILIELQKTSLLYFFVQEEKYNDSQSKITASEIAWLDFFGTIKVLQGQNHDNVRAQEFHRFISQNIE